MNKYANHVYVIPEDRRDEEIANGFIGHHQVKVAPIQVMPPAGGWPSVLKTFQVEYIPKLQNNPFAHVVMVIDFDDQIDKRRAEFDQAIPDDLKARVFVIGSKDEPETLKKALKMKYEEIGNALAADCDANATGYWDHEQIQHNDAVRRRLIQTIKPFLF